MATVLDTGLLKTFDIIFPFILVWALVYALLHKTKALGDRPAINVIVAIAVAFMVLLSRTILELINFIIPWFTVAIIFVVLLLLIFQIFGAQEKDIMGALKSNNAISWTIVAIAIIIMVAGFGKVLGQKLTEAGFEGGEFNTTVADENNFSTNVYKTLFNTKVLGLMVFFLIAIFATLLLTTS